MWPLMIGLTAAQMYSNAEKEQRQKQLASATQRYSPWTGLQAQPVSYADPLGTAAQGAAGGLAMEQMSQNSDAQKKLMEAQTGFFDRANGGKAGASATPMTAMPSTDSGMMSYNDYRAKNPWWSPSMNSGGGY